MSISPRARAQAMAVGSGGQDTLAVPFALRLAARIQERPLEEFFDDPTELANGLRDLFNAVGPDGVFVTAPDVIADEIASTAPEALTAAPRVACALEAAKRLRATLLDSGAVVAGLPGPAAVVQARGGKEGLGEVLQGLAREFLSAGVDVLLFVEDSGASVGEFQASLRTVENMARFHRAAVFLHGMEMEPLRSPTVVELDTPGPRKGLVITDEDLSADTSITDVQDWVDAIRSSSP